MLRINNLKLPLTADIQAVRIAAAERLNISAAAFRCFQISRKSVDARSRQQIWCIYSVDVEVDGDE